MSILKNSVSENMQLNPNIEEQLSNLPLSPGIYKFLDKNGIILYIGKANNLRSRVRSYFRTDHIDRPHIIPMIPQINKIETIETDNNIEAVVLETALIKEYLPKYNVEMKDDKSHAWLYINTRDEIPTVKIVRSLNLDEYKRGRLFGPYPNGRSVWQVFRYIRKLHPFCTCNDPKEPCLYYKLGLCNNPKFGEYTVEEYREGINEIIKFLSGHKKNHIKKLKQQMKDLSDNMEYESAAKLRDKISDLEHLGENINYYESEDEYLAFHKKSIEKQLSSISKDIDIENTLKRIECYDISNLQGQQAYGSMSVAVDGYLKNSNYRIFKIQSVDTPNDYQMLYEVLNRRLQNIGNGSDESLNEMPQMIVIDGGKGQLGKLIDLIPKEIILLGISKGKAAKKKDKRRKDEFWIRKEDKIEKAYLSTPGIIIRLRDEAHRFAIKHHRSLRSKSSRNSVLDSIEGIGIKRRKLLIKKFGSVDEIKKAKFEQINEIIKNKTTSKRLIERLDIKDQ